MAQQKAKHKKRKARQRPKPIPTAPAQAEITDPQKVNAEPQQQAIKNTDNPPEDTHKKRMTLAEKLSLGLVFGLFCINAVTLWTIREDAKLEKRAWIGLSSPIRHPIKSGEKFPYEIIFTNTGKTPGIGTKILFRLSSDPNDSYILDFFEKAIPNDPNFGAAPLAPNARLSVSEITKEISEPLFQRIESGKTVIFVLVKIEYGDIFGDRHKTHACLRYSPEKQILVAYHKYNYMD